MKTGKRIRWKLGTLAGLAVVLITCIPQLLLCVERGRDWQGSYALTDADELGYSAYLNSLIRGRPRRNNPESSDVSTAHSPRPESIFSIQFIPPYLIAHAARLLGMSASTAFILLIPLMAFASSLAVFWLLVEVTGDDRMAAIGVLIVLFCGVFASPAPLTAHNNYYAVFSFLRRYIPAVPFPLFFVFCVFAWRSFTRPGDRSLWWAAVAGVTLTLLVYSYFFLWTAALAWFFCLTLLWLVARPIERSHVLKCVAVCITIMIAAMIPYLYLVSLRSSAIDRDVALVLTHAPDLFRFTEILGGLILSALVLGAYRRTVDWKSPSILFAASCAMAPFIAFNQQVITGRSLQPFHYEQFILNYQLLVGAVILDRMVLNLLWKRRVFVVALALVAGATLAVKTSIINSLQNLMRDEAIPVFNRLDNDFVSNPVTGGVLVGHTLLAADAPTSCSVPVLWSPYTYTYGTISAAADHERLFQYLYYLNVDEQKFEELLKEEVVYRAALFGVPRVNRVLTRRFEPVSLEEISAQVESYAQYIRGFSRERARLWPLSYVVLFDRHPHDLANLDRWYERDGGERIGSSVLYRVRLRPAR